MTDTDDQDTQKKKSLRLERPGKLELKKTVESGQVRQSFSHGRSKMVQVEVRKKRTYTQDSSGQMAEITHAATPSLELFGEKILEAPHLTSEEKAARMKALEAARLVEEEDRVRAEAAAEAEPEESEQDLAAVEAGKERQAEKEQKAREAEEAEKARLEEEARKAEETLQLEQKAAAQPTGTSAAAKPRSHKGATEAEETHSRRGPSKTERRPSNARRGEPRRRSGRLTIADALSDSGGERTRSLASVRRAREREKQKLRQQQAEAQKIVRDVTIPETITVQELANRMAERGADVVKTLMKMDVMATITQSIDGDTAELVVAEFGHHVKRVSDADVELGLGGGDDAERDLMSRPPVVTVMGHVDHGKTSLLDALRETDVAEGEAGGITQHIGAYQVQLSDGAKITFVDTPGHAAFTEMRARGAKVTDIVVLVVAADDGIMPQTVEAIHHAKAAEVPLIVAVNKMDKPNADPTRVRTDLLQHEIQVEDMGGEILAVDVSAKARTNLDKLEEAILLQAEILDLKANPNCPGEGVIVEARMERGRGSVATVLIQRGTLSVGDIFVAGKEWGRVRALMDSYGKKVKSAGPGMPVEIFGLNGTPAAGDDMVVVDTEARAREVSEFRQRKEREARVAASARGTLEQMFSKIKEGEAENVPVVIKGDVHGSVEAIIGALNKLSTEEVKVQVLHSGVGGVNESDVTLARASEALIIGFNVRANPQAREMAARDRVEIRYYSIIYDVTDDLKKLMSGMLAPTIRETFIGYAAIREVFNITKVGKVAGCMVTEGQVKRGARVRLLRDDVVVHEGELSQLRRFKDDVKEVKDGMECGMSFAKYNDIQVGDVIECFEVEEVAREL